MSNWLEEHQKRMNSTYAVLDFIDIVKKKNELDIKEIKEASSKIEKVARLENINKIREAKVEEDEFKQEDFLPLKPTYSSFIKWKIERRKDGGREYSKDMVDGFYTSKNYLIEFLEDENFNILKLEKKDFRQILEKFKRVPSRWKFRKEFKDMKLNEVVRVKHTYETLTNNTINKIMKQYEEFFSYLNYMDLFANDIFNNFIYLQKNQSVSHEMYTFEELKKLFNGEDKLIEEELKMLLYTGLRIKELSNLRGKDIKKVEDIWVMEIREDMKKGIRLKNKNSMRTIPIHSKILNIVLKRKDLKGDEGFILGNGNSNLEGKRTIRYIRKHLKDTIKGNHSFRYNFVHNLLKNASNDYNIAKYLTGHHKGDREELITLNYASNEIGSLSDRKRVIELLSFNI